MATSVDPGSFRDPSGFVFRRDGVLYRQINKRYQPHWEQLISSGLHDSLVRSGKIVPFQEASLDLAMTDEAFAVIQPEPLTFISYPYEWSFSQLKDAAVLTIDIMLEALEHNMILKDATAYNVQFKAGKPVFIDTLSFEKYEEGTPWVAYLQYCKHFLAPLALASYCDVRLLSLLVSNIDGIPLDLASQLLPGSTKLNFKLASHLHLHAAATKAQSDGKPRSQAQSTVKKASLIALIQNLREAVVQLKWSPTGTEWADYYNNTNYSSTAMASKRKLVAEFIEAVPEPIKTANDFGANNGAFTMLCAERGIQTRAWDIDPAAVEQGYLAIQKSGNPNVLPLLIDLANPTPPRGWMLEERSSFFDRSYADLTLALAVIHHLVFRNNSPIPQVMEFFARSSRYLILEWVPENDSQVVRMIDDHNGIHHEYTIDALLRATSGHFDILKEAEIPESNRRLYLLKNKQCSDV